MSQQIFYQWKRAYVAESEIGRVNSKPCPENPKLRTLTHVEEKDATLKELISDDGLRARREFNVRQIKALAMCLGVNPSAFL